MGASNRNVSWLRGPRVPRDDREPAPPPTAESLTAARDAAHQPTDAALADVSNLLGWTDAQCLGAAAGLIGWPPCLEIDTLAVVIAFEHALAAEADAAATLRAFEGALQDAGAAE